MAQGQRKASLHFDVDDVVQETYAILATKASVDAINDPKTYAFQVAYSVILQQLRRSRVVPITAVADIGTLETVMDEPSPEDTVLARFELEQVRRAIDALPRKTRAAFVMRRVEGLSQQEIARRLNVSEHTIQKHVARGIKLLLAQFSRDGGQGASKVADNKKTGLVERDHAQAKRKIH
ncbi:RNA polymerase sigma factor [Azospirillum sp. B4]|uniref:RNA polymerase sigma factor n=1 Tax=Azospirillum sp. B4 TaxID=95605 RepID=UPI0005C932F9|nr:RNA polymerase sigma factor [Azospirillum sp. B4]